MAQSLNKCMFIGDVGKDGELRYTQSGTAVVNFGLACTESRPDESKPSGWAQQTEWVNCVVWAERAERIHPLILKGNKLYVEGKLQTRDWVDPQGVKHYKTELVVQNWVPIEFGADAWDWRSRRRSTKSKPTPGELLDGTEPE